MNRALYWLYAIVIIVLLSIGFLGSKSSLKVDRVKQNVKAKLRTGIIGKENDRYVLFLDTTSSDTSVSKALYAFKVKFSGKQMARMSKSLSLKDAYPESDIYVVSDKMR